MLLNRWEGGARGCNVHMLRIKRQHGVVVVMMMMMRQWAVKFSSTYDVDNL